MNRGRIPSLDWLRAFEAAARTGSFAGAARLLNVSAAAASKQIRALESYLGAPLFVRHAHSVEITKAGRDFLPAVQQSLFAIEATAAAMFGEQAGSAVALRLPHIVACSWLVARLPRFVAAHPDIRVQLFTEASRPPPFADVSALSIRFGGSPDSGGDHDRLFGETVHPVAPPSIAPAIRTAADLAAYPLIGVGAHRSGWPELLAHGGVAAPRLDVTFVDSTAVALMLADAGGAVALARSPATDALVDRLGLVRCAAPLHLTTHDAYFLTYPSHRSLGPAARTFRAWLVAEARETQAV